MNRFHKTALFIASLSVAACGSTETSCPSCTGGAGGNGTTTNTTSSSSSSTTSETTTSSAATGGGGQGGSAAVWHAPDCAIVEGTAAVTFTRDEGKTLTPTKDTLVPISYTWGLVALDTPNTLLAEHQGALLRSEDAGCTWATMGSVVGSPLTLSAAKGGRAYAFQDNNATLYRIEGTAIQKLTAPAVSVLGVGADPSDGAHVRLGDEVGQLWDSTDGGETWAALGVPAPVSNLPLVYSYAFDPHDFNHIIVGSATTGALVTMDGGATWVSATGLAAKGVNVFSIVVAPSDGKVVWAQGIDLEHTSDPVSSGRYIWRSADGGLTFGKVAEQTDKITIRNQELLAAHPSNASVLYFVFGTYFQGYGTDIYRYDHQTGHVTTTHNDYSDVSSIAFSPVNPEIMYLGLTADGAL